MLFGGTSAGSIVASLYAMGYNSDEMIKLFNYFSKTIMGIGPKYLFANVRETKGIKIKGIISSINIELAFQEVGKLKNILNMSDIKMPIVIPATDLIKNQEIVFTNSSLLEGEKYIKDISIGKAVRASSSFPGIYSPFEYKDYQFVDGGIFDNLPAEEVKKLGVDKIISVKFDLKRQKKQNTMYNITMQSIDLIVENLLEKSINASDVLLNIDVKDVKAFNASKFDFCYQQGYNQTIDNIKEIKKKLL